MATTQEKESEGEHPISMPEAMRAAAAQLAELLRQEPGSVSAVKREDHGWTAEVEVMEIERVPDTTSVMASYRVELDERARIVGYRRTRRYARGQIDR